MSIVLIWHFHQPYYAPPEAADFELPWVRLHAAKSYLDMAAMLERQGVELLYPPRDLGWCKRTAVSDPDGNNIELTELGADWYRHLEKHQEPSDPPPREPKLKALDSD